MRTQRLSLMGLVLLFSIALTGCKEVITEIDLMPTTTSEKRASPEIEETRTQVVETPLLEVYPLDVSEFPEVDMGDGRVFGSPHGMKVVVVWLFFKYNAESFDRWIEIDTWGPLLVTEEGYKYDDFAPPVALSRYYVSPQRLRDLPSGIVVGSMGKDHQSARGWRFFYEVPINSTPKSLEIDCKIKDFEWTKYVVDLTKPYQGSIPFGPEIKTTVVGEPIEVGNFATFTIVSSGSFDSELPLSFTITSRHEAYALDLSELVLGVVNEHGRMITDTEIYSRILHSQTIFQNIGPSMSMTADFVWEDVPPGKLWLFGRITIREDSPDKSSASADFVIELP